jgi:hypothetical protein
LKLSANVLVTVSRGFQLGGVVPIAQAGVADRTIHITAKENKVRAQHLRPGPKTLMVDLRRMASDPVGHRPR